MREDGPAQQAEAQLRKVMDIPDNYKAQTADNAEEGWRYCQGDKNARRPPELLTRDHVARCIMREVREGRGTPHGGDRPRSSSAPVPVILITYATTEDAVRRALKAVQRDKVISGKPQVIRIEKN